MATFTPNYNLEKPTGAEKYYISKFNANSDKIDTALKTQADAISANLTQEEEDISNLRDELQEYADNKVSAHNLSQEAHPFIQNAIDDALSEAKDYTDAKPNANDVVNAHNISDSAHQDIRDAISGIGSTAQTMIDNSIALHNVDITAHQDIRTDAENYTDNAIEEHDEDPNAHGGKQVVYTRLTANGNDYISSMSYLDIQTAFSDGQNVSALLNNGGEMPIEVTIDSITAKRIVVDGNNLTLETYTMDSTTNAFTKTTTDYNMVQTPSAVGTAIVDQATVGSMGFADWNASENDMKYIANKPFGTTNSVTRTEIFNGTVSGTLAVSGTFHAYDETDGINYAYEITISDGTNSDTQVVSYNSADIVSDQATVEFSDDYTLTFTSSSVTITPTDAEVTELTVQVTGIKTTEVVTKIDSKYLPESSGGSGVFEVEFTIDTSESTPTVTSSHTFAEIADAITNKQSIRAIGNTPYGTYRMYDLSEFRVGPDEGYFNFEHIVVGSRAVTCVSIAVLDDNTVDIMKTELEPSQS